MGLTEDDCLRQFEAVAEFAQLKKAGGGFGVKHLFRQLVELQGAMVMKLDKTSLISEVRSRSDSSTPCITRASSKTCHLVLGMNALLLLQVQQPVRFKPDNSRSIGQLAAGAYVPKCMSHCCVPRSTESDAEVQSRHYHIQC